MEMTPMTPQEFLLVVEEIDDPKTYWLDTYFNDFYFSDNKLIAIEKLKKGKRVRAPMVLPASYGRPIYSESNAVQMVQPGYIKIFDTITVDDTSTGTIGEKKTYISSRSGRSRRELVEEKRADIIVQHNAAVVQRLEDMAAQTVINGFIILKYEGAPDQRVDFGRDPELTRVLAPGAQWTEEGSSPIETIQDGMDLIREKKGGAVSRITFGLAAWKAARRHAEFKDLMDKRYAGSDVSLARGLIASDEVQMVGTINMVPVFVYSDYYEVKVGNEVERVDMMDPRDIVLTTSKIDGVRCYGYIDDDRANNESLAIFMVQTLPDQQTGKSGILTQSAPITIPREINGSCRIRVVS